MLKLEEYILKRKKEDGINELEADKRADNTRICVNYVFEYFNNYLSSNSADEKTVLHEEKVEKLRATLRDYDEEIQEWLTSLYSAHGKHMHRNLANLINDTYFLLYDSDAEFRSLSYEIYPKAVKKFPFLNGQPEMVYQFIKDHHRVQSMFSPYAEFCIFESIDEWINNTYQKYGVNIYNFCNEWIRTFGDSPDSWPRTHKKRSQYYDEYIKKDSKISKSMLWEYDYTQKSNLFNLDSLYRNMPKKIFTKNRKQHFETLLLYCWMHYWENNEAYWNEYMDAASPNL